MHNIFFYLGLVAAGLAMFMIAQILLLNKKPNNKHHNANLNALNECIKQNEKHINNNELITLEQKISRMPIRKG